MKPTRRGAIAASAGALIVATGGYEVFRALHKRYKPTPYDDLLSGLSDREAARQLGAAFLSVHSDFTPTVAARVLRQRVAGRGLSATLDDEIARGELTEAGQWIVPQTLAGLCALAARA
jgi:hypothetical protein